MFGEFEEMIFYHGLLIKLMLGVLLVGLIIPFLSKDCGKTVKRTRIYMFVSHAVLTSIAFSGLVAFIFSQMEFNFSMFIMIVAFLALIGIEVLKYRIILKSQKLESCVGKIKLTALMYNMFNITI